MADFGKQDVNKQLREARRLLNTMTRVCRQTQTYLEGVSAMDQARMKKALNEAIRNTERFLNC